MESLVRPGTIHATMKHAIHPLSRCAIALGAALLAVSVAGAEPTPIVINEIMYHPPGDRDDLQYLELHNPGKEACDLSGWSFSKGVKFNFPAGTKLPSGACLVVCRNRAAFTRHYGKDVPLAGEFSGHLSHNGERVELSDSNQKVIDAVKYTDQPPWPISADGHSSSLERISPLAMGGDVSNWAASNLPEIETPAGTPGRINDSF